MKKFRKKNKKSQIRFQRQLSTIAKQTYMQGLGNIER